MAHSLPDETLNAAMARYLVLREVEKKLRHLTENFPDSAATTSLSTSGGFNALETVANEAAELVAQLCNAPSPKACLISEALSEVAQIGNEWDRETSLRRIAMALARAGDTADALSVAAQI